jgi:hypothetical protein
MYHPFVAMLRGSVGCRDWRQYVQALGGELAATRVGFDR